MNLTYDPEADAACIDLVDVKPGMAKETVPLLPEQTGGHMINLDYDAQGRLISIEVLDASKVLPASALKSGQYPPFCTSLRGFPQALPQREDPK